VNGRRRGAKRYGNRTRAETRATFHISNKHDHQRAASRNSGDAAIARLRHVRRKPVFDESRFQNELRAGADAVAVFTSGFRPRRASQFVATRISQHTLQRFVDSGSTHRAAAYEKLDVTHVSDDTEHRSHPNQQTCWIEATRRPVSCDAATRPR